MPADERREIEAAMDRLLNGTPLRSDGKLTIVSLAAEAGVKRHALTHKHTDLKDLFNARVKSQHSVPASETALREQNAELRRKLDDMRAERDEYKQAADALARALNVLTTENDELRRRASRAREFTGPRPLAQLRAVPTAGGSLAASRPGVSRGVSSRPLFATTHETRTTQVSAGRSSCFDPDPAMKHIQDEGAADSHAI
jgi:hypothetical protein